MVGYMVDPGGKGGDPNSPGVPGKGKASRDKSGTGGE